MEQQGKIVDLGGVPVVLGVDVPPTPSITPTITPTPSITPTITPTQTITPTITPSSTITPTPTPTSGATSAVRLLILGDPQVSTVSGESERENAQMYY